MARTKLDQIIYLTKQLQCIWMQIPPFMLRQNFSSDRSETSQSSRAIDLQHGSYKSSFFSVYMPLCPEILVWMNLCSHSLKESKYASLYCLFISELGGDTQ